MKEDELKRFESMSDHELLDFVTEKDSSQRKWAAQHILEKRRNQILSKATVWAAIAGVGSAIAAIVSAFVALEKFMNKAG